MTETTTHRPPAQLADEWLTAVAADLEVRFTTTDAGCIRATVLAPHPLAPDVSMRLSFVGADRAAALAGVRTQLKMRARAVYTDPSRHAAAAADAREATLYTPSPRNIHKVGLALIARGHPKNQGGSHEIQRAHLALKIDRGHDDHLIAEVVDEVLAQRRRMQQVLDARPVRDARQAALL